ncbi:hypothetical protein [uncultured Sphingomonas sp.]|uniref:hypothetical protein n=1 Tax=uncultured Sphingomonas sp. TaxID=158754 RepID=UPI0025FC3EBC|nr:hypothetical protein [uncultured Sphingomonas sp.]
MIDPEMALVLPSARNPRRSATETLFALDARLTELTRFTRDAFVAQMRLTWWFGALEALDARPAPAEPLLQAIRRDLVPLVPGTKLAGMIEGWEELLDPEPLDDDRLRRFAERRGGGLFAAFARVLNARGEDPVAEAGTGWALIDLAENTPDRAAADRARHLAVGYLSTATGARWSRAGRPIGALAHLATMPHRSPAARSLRVLRHRFTGR